jgi:Rps23 Pro-64 3,4-dihydroxylase Tpa1-like proline 4-hydroxylase
MKVFSSDKLQSLAQAHSDKFRNTQPFPHVIFDDFASENALDAALRDFPTPNDITFYQYDNPLEKKLAFDQIDKLPESISRILHEMSHPPFLQFLEELTGIKSLLPDPYYRGGGIHQILPGGKLDVHIDFNLHKRYPLQRRLNAILFLNKSWQDSYNGYLELWRGHQENGKHILDACERKILPQFNRLVVFETSEHSYHGHPDPLTCPEGMSRKSIATYYYTIPESQLAPRSTTFVKRPGDPEDPNLDNLRRARSIERLSTNIPYEP